MKNEAAVQICGEHYVFIMEEPEDYIKSLALEVANLIDTKSQHGASLQNAAIMACVELCDKMRKLAQDGGNTQREIAEVS